MSVLNFEGYLVEKMTYDRNPNFDKKFAQFKMSPTIELKNQVDGEKIQVSLGITVGKQNDSKIPFSATVIIVGKFSYQPDEDTESIGLTALVRNNAVAILYPYARALIAQLTTASNEFPGYNLPTINVPEALK